MVLRLFLLSPTRYIMETQANAISTKLKRDKVMLQALVAIGGLVPFGAGFSGILMGPAMIDLNLLMPATFDSHFRYLSGLLLGIGLAFWSTIPHLERKTERFLTLTFVVIVGGFSRVVSLWAVGVPDKPMLFGLGMELVITPLLALAQYKLAQGFAASRKL